MSSQSTDELREAINKRFDTVTSEGHTQSCGQYQTAVDDVMQFIASYTDKKMREARIDELNHVISKVNGVGIFSWYNNDFVSRKKRIQQLKESEEK